MQEVRGLTAGFLDQSGHGLGLHAEDVFGGIDLDLLVVLADDEGDDV